MLILNLFDETEKLSDELKKVIMDTAKASIVACGVSERCSVDVLIIDLANMQEINMDKRGINAPTDVLSFPTNENNFLGDIVIAYEKIFSQAVEYGHSDEREAGFLTAHAMLHLMGYDHDTPDDEAQMQKMQEHILSGLNLHR